jgi:hypothetical protein
VTDVEKAVSATVVGVAGGAYAMLTGLFTLDPSLLLSGVWVGPATMVSRFIGPELVPGIPWSLVTLLVATASVLVSFYKYSQRRNQQS